MELLAGEESLLTSVKENNCVFAMDYAKVYWNSKLEPEHRRIVESLRSTDILADAFAGVGPFVIPAAKKRGCRSYGNDLNPSSVVCTFPCCDSQTDLHRYSLFAPLWQ